MIYVCAVFRAFNIHHFCLIRAIRGRYYSFLSSRLRVVIWLAWSTRTVQIRERHRSDSKFCSECLFQNIMTSCNKHRTKNGKRLELQEAECSQRKKPTERQPAGNWEHRRRNQQLVLWSFHKVFSPTTPSSLLNEELVRVMHLQSSGADQGNFTLVKIIHIGN